MSTSTHASINMASSSASQNILSEQHHFSETTGTIQPDTFAPGFTTTSLAFGPRSNHLLEINEPSPKHPSSVVFPLSSFTESPTPAASYTFPPSAAGPSTPTPAPAARSRAFDIGRDSPEPSSSSSSRFLGLRRGSLMPAMLASPIAPSVRRGSDPSSPIELSRMTSPLFSSTLTPPSAGPSKSRDTIEIMATTIKARHKAQFEPLEVDRSREEQAMAKWRKWIVEQPSQPPSADSSPVKSRKSSPAGTHIPLVPIHPHLDITPAQASSSRLPSRHNSGESSSHSNPHSATSSKLDIAETEIINTDTMRALRDVELAIDQTVNTARSASHPRRLSTNPRISEAENPFIDLGSRLASRRVRPLVIELIQALGHYIDAVWSMSYPGVPCPWVDDPSQPKASTNDVWRSKMIHAVQEGKKQGHVPNPQGPGDVAFWGGEVKYSLRDVDEVVGIYKGAHWAFASAITKGQYGEVKAGNVLRRDGSGGNLARLLNDLEEAMWGDAPPRPTDLSWDLPEDFDPYAEPTAEELAQAGGGGGGGLASFFTDSKDSTSRQGTPVGPAPEGIYDVPLPKLQMDTDSEVSRSPVSPMPIVPSREATPVPLTGTKADPLGLDAFRTDGTELTLEEIGRRRHQEWLQSKQAQGW